MTMPEIYIYVFPKGHGVHKEDSEEGEGESRSKKNLIKNNVRSLEIYIK